jgi:hypothetical protein
MLLSTSAAITLQPGEFKIYGNKSLAIANFEKQAEIYLYLIPTDYFTLNTTSKVQVFSITGQ